VLASRTAFSYREPAEIGWKTQNFSTPPTHTHTSAAGQLLLPPRLAIAMPALLLAAAALLLTSSGFAELVLEPPTLVGRSNGSATHYWFPTNFAVVFNESHFLLDARLADDCSDYFCNHTGKHVSTCKPSDPSHQISLSTDGGRSFAPQWNVGGTSPWSQGLRSRPYLGSVTLELNDTARLTLYQGKTWAPWETTAVVFALDPVSGLRWELAERTVTYEGAESVCSSSRDGHLWNQNVIETPNTTGYRWLLSAQCDVKVGTGNQTKKESSLLIFRSTDGYRWRLKSAVQAVAPAGATECDSPGETTLVELGGGSGGGSGDDLLLLSRCGDGQQLLGWRSVDGATTWQRHELPPNMHGVMPVAVRMESGAIVLVTGRGGLALWLNARGDGQDWVLTNLAESHNRLVLQNRELNGTALQYTAAFVGFNATKVIIKRVFLRHFHTKGRTDILSSQAQDKHSNPPPPTKKNIRFSL
jgi:hypothetical protein